MFAYGVLWGQDLTGRKPMNYEPGHIVNPWIPNNVNPFEYISFMCTGEVVIIPAGKKAVFEFNDKCKVSINPFVMSQYEVTQELYKKIMAHDFSEINIPDSEWNPSYFKQDVTKKIPQQILPVENVTFYEAVVFCNNLTKQLLKESDIVYFSDSKKTKAYSIYDARDKVTPYMDITKKGYRLPTEAEWEYAARGGIPNSAEWDSMFGITGAEIFQGMETSDVHDISGQDINVLKKIAWYEENSNSTTHNCGDKRKNNLNLYDMVGNVAEWCWDWYEKIETFTEEKENPCGPESGQQRVVRGGAYNTNFSDSAVVVRSRFSPDTKDSGIGFRFCRTTDFEQSCIDNEIKEFLTSSRPFGDYLIFNSMYDRDNTFKSEYYDLKKNQIRVDGDYSIYDGMISFSVTYSNTGKLYIETKDYGKFRFNDRYRFLKDRISSDLKYTGCLESYFLASNADEYTKNIINRNIAYTYDFRDHFYTFIPTLEGAEVEIEGVKAKKINKKLYIKENLRMRKEPNLNSKVVDVHGRNYDFGSVDEWRKVVFAGTVIEPLAQTVELSTIDGITAPWYLIKENHNNNGKHWTSEYDFRYAWIFGGYVEDVTNSTTIKTSNEVEVRKAVKDAGLKFVELDN